MQVVDGRVDHVRGHRHRHVGKRLERREVHGLQLVQRGLDHWQVHVAVDPGPAVTRQVLDHRQDAAVHQALAGGAAQFGDLVRRDGIGPVADHVMGPGLGHVEHGQAVHGDPDGGEVMGHEPRAETRHVGPLLLRQQAVGSARRIAPPMGRAEPLDATAFLIDQHGRIGAADAGAQGLGQPPDLVGRIDIALEQDEAPRLDVPIERPLLGRQGLTRASQDGGVGRHFTKQFLPAALSLSQKAVASARLAKPVTAVR